MSAQPSLIAVAADAHVLRPITTTEWQLFRDTAAAGDGTYWAMNAAGVKEPLAGAGPSNAVGVYEANLTQAGVAAPTASVLSNNLGGVPVFAYVGPGVYTMTLAGAFGTAATTSLIPGSPVAAGSTVRLTWTSADVITINTENAADAAADVLLANTTILVKVYPAP